MLEKIQKYSLIIILLFSLGLILKNKDLCKTDYALLSVLMLTLLVLSDQIFDKQENFATNIQATVTTSPSTVTIPAKSATSTTTTASATTAASTTTSAKTAASTTTTAPAASTTTTAPAASTTTTAPAASTTTTAPAVSTTTTIKPVSSSTTTMAPATQTKSDADLLIKKGLYAKYDYLNNLEYREKDPSYYISPGDLIDNSWDNSYSLVDSRHWKPYTSIPPVCKNKDLPCVPCNSGQYLPYLELKNFNQDTVK
jgi:hypothetical protein